MKKTVLLAIVLSFSGFAIASEQTFDSIKLKPQSSTPVCSAATAGTFYVDSDNLAQYCDGTSWFNVSALDLAGCADCIGATEIDESDDYVFDSSDNEFTGTFTGDVTGNVTGDVTGDLSGLVTISLSASPPATCDAGHEGELYADTSHALCFCDGSDWTKVVGAGTCS